jgi:hypothetical protein
MRNACVKFAFGISFYFESRTPFANPQRWLTQALAL